MKYIYGHFQDFNRMAVWHFISSARKKNTNQKPTVKCQEGHVVEYEARLID